MAPILVAVICHVSHLYCLPAPRDDPRRARNGLRGVLTWAILRNHTVDDGGFDAVDNVVAGA